MSWRLALLSALVLIAGCGKRESTLVPPQGASMPVKPQTALTRPSASDLLHKPTQAEPDRIDDPLARSVPRQDDRFHLPPPG